MFAGAALKYRAGCWGWGRRDRRAPIHLLLTGSSVAPVPEALRPDSQMQDLFPLSKKRLQTPNEPGRNLE